MTRRGSLFIGLLLVGATSAQSLPASNDPPVGATASQNGALPSQPSPGPVVRSVGRLPLSFESNQGQTDRSVRFLTHTADSTLFLTPTEAVFTMVTPSQGKQHASLFKDRRTHPAAKKSANVALRMQMIGADPTALTLSQQPLAGRVNYFRGNDPRKWHAGVPTFGRVGFQGAYPGVDVIYYGNQRHLEYDFVVAPHADPKQIQLHFAGAQSIRLDAVGDLRVRVQGRELKWQRPVVYQQDGSRKRAVPARFRLKRLSNGQAGVSFALGRYDTGRSLVIDPVLLYSTYLGGNGQQSYTGPDEFDGAWALAVDSSGSAYVTGTAASLDFPTTAGAYQTVNTDQYSIFVTKINPQGSALVYSTFLGGSDVDYAWGIAVDSSGAAYIAGETQSSDFPTTPGAFQTTRRTMYSEIAFVTKINPTGTALVYSTYLTDGTSVANAIAVDSSGNAYVTGNTVSPNFPVTAGAFQTLYKSNNTTLGGNAFVTKLNAAGSALLYSTYLGGSGIGLSGDSGAGIAIDNSGNAYITGSTVSADFPVTPGVFQTANHNMQQEDVSNIFVTKLNPTGTALVYSTFLGGSGQGGDNGDYADGIAIDAGGNAYITGGTYSKDFPTMPGAFQKNFPGHTGTPSVSGFVTKLNPTATFPLYSTFLAGSGGDTPSHIAVDSLGNACVAGSAYSTDFPTTVGAFQRTKGNSQDSYGFLTKLNAAGSGLLYSTYLGGTFNHAGVAIALDGAGNAYVAGQTGSSDFPTTPGAFQTTNHAYTEGTGGVNAFAAKLSPVSVFPDFNNDGCTDLLIQNAATGVIASWFMQGSRWVGGAYFSLTPPIEFALVGAGDFSGDGNTTLVLQSGTTNQIAFWYTSGTNHAIIPGGHFVNVTPEADWKVVGVGDFNGDGKSDLLFQNQTTNQVAVWFMNGYLDAGGVFLPFTPPTGWRVVGTGDFNGDGLTDIAFQNQTTGQIALWYMSGTTYLGGIVMTTVPAAGWKVVAVGDYNGDGSADLLFQNQTTNQAVVWYLKSGAFAGGSTLSLAPPAGWKIAGPR